MSKHLIFDQETMSTNVFDGVAIDQSMFVFEWDRFLTKPYTFSEIVDTAVRFKLDVKEQVNDYGYKVEKDTVEFWKNQDKVVRKRMAPSSDDIALADFGDKVLNYLNANKPIKYWWTRGNTFDPIFQERIFRSIGKKTDLYSILNHNTVRDIRTFIDAKFDFSVHNNFVPIADTEYWENTFEHHNSVHDIAGDVLRLQTIVRGENNLEQTER